MHARGIIMGILKVRRGAYMKCPYCSYTESKVTDSRPTEDDLKIRRRRECVGCGGRFTTYEIIETSPIIVLKKDNSRQIFSRDKLLKGMLRACEKRSVSVEKLEKAVDEIEFLCASSANREISSEQLGEMALQKLKDIDEVAYVRFASVYREFSDVESFFSELQQLFHHRNHTL